jgi:hypothetical protein
MNSGISSRVKQGVFTAGAIFAFAAAGLSQAPLSAPAPAPAAASAPAPGVPSAADRAAMAAAAAAERDRELKQLGITAMQQGKSAYDIGKPGNANYDESLANPYPKIPDVLTMNDGTKVTTPAQWQKRRAEIKAFFDENVYGKYPEHLPGVTWKVNSVERVAVAGVPAVVKHVLGHVDNSSFPAITVEIHADVVTPASTEGKRVPVIIGGASLHPFAFPRAAPAPGQVVHMISVPDNPPDSAKLLLEHGWGFVSRSPTEVQADSGGGLDKGIIGLVNRGQPRKPDDWGVLRAWAWGDSRILDYLLTDPDVDGTKVGIMGHSRYGNAAVVTEADDPRFAIGYISSSGKGGVVPFRRDFGETLPNSMSAGAFDWFAANLMRYAEVGHSANDLLMDSPEFLALIAPRPVFIGGGVLITDPQYAPGDAWQDITGSFIAAVDASPVWNLLGAKGLGVTELPAVNTLVDTGDVAFRQHPYGHTPAPNWPYFIEFADKEFSKTSAARR